MFIELTTAAFLLFAGDRSVCKTFASCLFKKKSIQGPGTAIGKGTAFVKTGD
jgi:hypothetical protein